MSEIELKRANVVKRVDSEDKAKALEAKGFVRTDGTVANKTESNAASEAVINELKDCLARKDGLRRIWLMLLGFVRQLSTNGIMSLFLV